VIFDVEIRDVNQYQEFMKGVKPAIEAAGGKYLARGGQHKVYEGDWQPRRIVLLDSPLSLLRVLLQPDRSTRLSSPSVIACSSARFVSVEGLPS